ncbi:hypothetical protein LEP1GSC005_1278 [Leptospira santarosai str. ST188]|nr:hypothetical protein LEP1GSC005_1278 [Leptospira santarosai str. ST188]EMI69363.1 hypothetical protein LEP1GSC076_2009 [Leptospira sp. Fiocruz LV4135]EMO24504.1 hypothetical protein LEP1GSC168_3308 [Leptospira santarosai str. HAI134]
MFFISGVSIKFKDKDLKIKFRMKSPFCDRSNSFYGASLPFKA